MAETTAFEDEGLLEGQTCGVEGVNSAVTDHDGRPYVILFVTRQGVKVERVNVYALQWLT